MYHTRAYSEREVEDKSLEKGFKKEKKYQTFVLKAIYSFHQSVGINNLP